MEKKILRQQEHKGGLVIAVGLFHVGLFTDENTARAEQLMQLGFYTVDSMLLVEVSSLQSKQENIYALLRYLLNAAHGTDSVSGPRCQDSILGGGGAEAQIRFKAASKQSDDPPLLRVNTLGSGEDNMKLKELMELFNAVRLNLLLPVLVYDVRHSLTAARHKVNPTIYTTCIEQFWTSAKVKTVNGERQIQALVDKKKVIISETSIRSDLKLDDAEGTNCLSTATIFAELERIGKKIEVLDADAEVTLVDETQEMNDDNLMFDTSMLKEHGIEFEKVVKEPVVSVATITKSIPVSAAKVVTTASASVEIPDELTLA
ncbi:hypothetical protein Tco_0522682 [Tanacetum coccineum]